MLTRRWPHVRLFLFPSAVQGETAPKELREALDRAIRFSQLHHGLDVLILTRGGGSTEDLAAFNDEALARDLYACPIPIISAVGHEIDFSISDFVADLRAPTPSAAAEVAVPDRIEVLGMVQSCLHRMLRQTRNVWKGRFDEFRLRADACMLRSPQRRFETYEQRLDLGLEAALRNMASLWKTRQDASRHWAEILRLSDPSLPLHRGYSLTVRQGDTRPIRSISDLSIGDPIETHLADGLLLSHVKEVTPHES